MGAANAMPQLLACRGGDVAGQLASMGQHSGVQDAAQAAAAQQQQTGVAAGSGAHLPPTHVKHSQGDGREQRNKIKLEKEADVSRGTRHNGSKKHSTACKPHERAPE